MQIVFFGSPQAAVYSLESLLESGHDIELVITQPDRPSGRGRKDTPPAAKVYAQENGIPVIQPRKIRKDEDAFNRINEISPGLNVVVAYGQIIPSHIIYLPPHNTVNVHFSLLPKYRGAAPVQWALRQGETKTGITIFELDEKMDEGPILAQKTVSIHPGENAGALSERLARLGAGFLSETIARIHEITPRPQNHAEATYAPLIKKQDGHIDWSQSAIDIDRLVRAFNPWPSTFSFLHEKRIKILKGIPLEKSDFGTAAQAAGTILAMSTEGAFIACGDGTLYRIEKIQPENKKPMDAYAYSLGGGIQTGDTLT